MNSLTGARLQRYREWYPRWYQQNRDRHLAKVAAFRKAHPEHVAEINRWAKLKMKYGVTKTDYLALYEKQEGRCGICNQFFAKFSDLGVDHDHATRRVRGLLCLPCNRVLGIMEKNRANIERYLMKVKES